jgi:hypothetical protein
VLEQRGAQGRGQGQGHEGREAHGQDQGHGELAVDRTDRTAEEEQGHEDRGQHHSDGDDGVDDLTHGLARGVARTEAFLAHDALDVLDHDDGIVHHDGDRQHHGEQGQHVDRIAEQVEADHGAEQRYRHDDGRYEGGARILEEQVHHQHHEDHGFDQGLDHLADGDVDEGRGVVGHHPGNALGESTWRAPSCAH